MFLPNKQIAKNLNLINNEDCFHKATFLLTSEAFLDSNFIGWEFSSHYWSQN